MKVFLAIIAAAGLGYFLGSLNFSIIVVRMMTGRDIRDMGSKNAGLTNTLRCAGKSCALFTLLGDLLKGIIAVALARGLCHLLHAGLMPGNDTHYIGYIAGFFAILGHVFPIYYSFKGGKGVLVGAASFLAVDYKVFLALLAIFAVILALSKYVSLASIISTAYCPLATLLMSWLIDGYSFGRSFLYLIMSLPMAAMVIWMHRSNIQRLLDGNENKFSFKTININ
ncbi:glycerol-3-phosphate 1-O-acyltransferase PlsY [Ruminococcus flavefaciens]|uniref:Glycerol-3-phosphate acyltransferase n=1 Tax=Ruminococcus flavefaciens TaxID=1265 RepID=A0A315Y5B3_RUMFL|nr:glycerol-3-phosphate 1-O-acyltransferase PlsY [Ruminococcus flavefaciens]PWJ15153.1 glycerol-3-phosphate acyltransferase PlsY [Ruminococcus flavefaciens]SSA40177.1 glycerol-3-phosphate acyltransferase PlsY [Ruminococcus flavefaciens]